MPIKVIHLDTGASDYPEALCHYNNQAPLWRALLWPHRSLPRGGFVFFIAMTSFLLLVPLLPLIGTAALWGLLPFLVLTVAALWFFMMRNYRDGYLVEEISLWPDHISLVRREPLGHRKNWATNPYWVKINRHDAPVKNYLTLSGGPREVQLGTFLTPEERMDLKSQIEDQLRALPQNEA